MIVLGLTALLNHEPQPQPELPDRGRPADAAGRRRAADPLDLRPGRTGYGRHVYAVGGNAEAARRAGINVAPDQASRPSSSAPRWPRSAASCSPLNTGKVSPGSGGGNTLLYAVGAAVIGGTSLFGGKGRALDAIIGGLVIATIANGLGLLNQASYINYIVTGGVLLLAASVDAISRRRRSAAGV